MRGAKVLIESATLQIHSGWKVGLTGANGSGKSSLFAMLRDQLHPDQGDLDMPPAWVIAHVAQETPGLAQSAIEYVLDGDAELRRIEADLAAAERIGDDAHNGAHIGELHARLHEIDGYAARSRAASLLAGLGFYNPISNARLQISPGLAHAPEPCAGADVSLRSVTAG